MFRINPNIDAILVELWTVQHPPPVPFSCPLRRPSAASASRSNSSNYSCLCCTVIVWVVWLQFFDTSISGSAGISARINRSVRHLSFDSDGRSGAIGGHQSPLYTSTEDGAKGIYTWPTASIVLRRRKPSSAASRRNPRSEGRRRIGYVIRDRR